MFFWKILKEKTKHNALQGTSTYNFRSSVSCILVQAILRASTPTSLQKKVSDTQFEQVLDRTEWNFFISTCFYGAVLWVSGPNQRYEHRYTLAITEQGLHSCESLLCSSQCPATEETGSQLEFGGGTDGTADPTWPKGSTATWCCVLQFKLGRKKGGGMLRSWHLSSKAPFRCDCFLGEGWMDGRVSIRPRDYWINSFVCLPSVCSFCLPC